VKIKRVNNGPDVESAFDRMIQIMALIGPTQSENAQIEYSALLGCGASIMVTAMGIEPTVETCSRVLARIVEKLVPILEEELRKK
jgi:hypothetical protein